MKPQGQYCTYSFNIAVNNPLALSELSKKLEETTGRINELKTLKEKIH